MPQRYQPTLAELATAYGLHGTPLYVSQLQAQRADGALVTAYAQWCTDEARSSEGPRSEGPQQRGPAAAARVRGAARASTCAPH